jgi:hypothetical protein
MAGEYLTAPKQKVREYAHELAYRLACEKLAGIADIERQCQNAGAGYSPVEKIITLKYLVNSYRINFPGGGVAVAGSDEPVPIKDKILILDYFTRARGTPLKGKWITYKELHEGINYFDVFATRTIKPLVTYFGGEPEKLLQTATSLGGRKADYGDAAVTFKAFPRLPVTFVLWRGDDEFPPEGSILFDSTASDYLSNDDIHTLCENIVWRLVRLSRNGR